MNYYRSCSQSCRNLMDYCRNCLWSCRSCLEKCRSWMGSSHREDELHPLKQLAGQQVPAPMPSQVRGLEPPSTDRA
ncbi:TPA: hypothetical protein U2R10_004060 [Proteus mirabilis]|nr:MULTISPECIES: hypothetical protein [Proteus]EKT9691435.1 hypothetical protein [Proteus mirabilis]EKT9692260.1 hypothetical protein [Proteus mirabilis]EKU0762797.1 hypothetical protein [Proteus mirabilis]EKU0763733.1 hypothetical protein [Proteus mirabilis]EKU2833763.1 hypothetical protein [Proteus mirabilis]